MRRAQAASPAAKQRRRHAFVQDDYNLDLAYITPRLMALAAPAVPGGAAPAAGAAPRDAAEDVARLLATHAGGARVFALSAEAARACEPLAAGCVVDAAFSFGESEVPPLALLSQLCGALDAHLQADARHVGVLVCGDGAGRTGVAAAAYLLHSGAAMSAEAAGAAFAKARLWDAVALPLASHRRYLEHLAAQREARDEPACLTLQRCVEARLKLPPAAAPPTLRLWQRDAAGALAVVAGCDALRPSRAGADVLYTFPASTPGLVGDVRVTLHEPRPAGPLLCAAWLHTAWLPRGGRVALTRGDVDRPAAAVAEEFSLRLRFAAAPAPPPRAPSPSAAALVAVRVRTPPPFKAAAVAALAAARVATPSAKAATPAKPSATPPVSPTSRPRNAAAATPAPAETMPRTPAASGSMAQQQPSSAAAAASGVTPPAAPAAAAPRETPERAAAMLAMERDFEAARREIESEAESRHALHGQLQRLLTTLGAPGGPAIAADELATARPQPPPAEVAAALVAAAGHIRALAAALAQEQRANAALRMQLAAAGGGTATAAAHQVPCS